MAKQNKQHFHAFTIKHDGRSNRIITQVGLSVAFDINNPPDPVSPIHESTALWDTGATGSVVTRGTAQALGLVPVGSTMVNHAGGSSASNTYLVHMRLPNTVMIPGVLVTECDDVAGGFGAIIGMDIISLGDFSITNIDGQTWMSFRVPSLHRVDYVLDANRIKYANVGRNAPCPCGKLDSNGAPVKFKNCHWLSMKSST